MRKCHVLIVAVLVAAIATDRAVGEVTSTVVDLVTRPGVTQRFLWIRPPAPKATIVSITGGSGVLLIQDDGTMQTREARCSPLARNRQAFAARDIALVLLDQASNGAVGNHADVRQVYRHVRARDAVPTWLQGASSSTESVAVAAVNLPASEPAGVIFISPSSLSATLLASITRPSLVVFHGDDPSQSAGSVYAGLTAAPVRDVLALAGGKPAGCSGPHTFDGIDEAFVAAIDSLVVKHTGDLVASAAAVEFYNGALDHYFITHLAAEIELLDAGVVIRGWTRTGQSFGVYTAAPAGASPVCRFYIPPERGNSHFYGRGVDECNATGANNPSFINETSQLFHVLLPTFGICPAGTRSVYRVFSNRADANHRYMTDASIRTQMVASGWIAEGDGPDLVVMCAPA